MRALAEKLVSALDDIREHGQPEGLEPADVVEVMLRAATDAPRRLAYASAVDCTSDQTEQGPGRLGDDEAVGDGPDGATATTFGMIRQSLEALGEP